MMSLSRVCKTFLQKHQLQKNYFFVSQRCISRQPYVSPKKIDLKHQSVLLPGIERIRASAYLDNPEKLIWKVPNFPEIENVYQALLHGFESSDHGQCLGSWNEEKNDYEWIRYSEVISRSQEIGSGIIEHEGIPKPNSLIGIFAENKEEFFLSAYSCTAYAMPFVPLYPSLSPDAIQFILQQADMTMVIANSEISALKVLEISKELPKLRTIVLMVPIKNEEMQDLARQRNIHLTTLKDLEALGKVHKKKLKLANLDDLYCVSYTSGTTGQPKGVMLSHKNLVSTISALIIGYGEAGVYGGTIISYLPLAHIYEIVNGIMSLFLGRRIAFYSGDIRNLMAEVHRLKPNVLPLVPRLMNAIYSKTLESIHQDPVKENLLNAGLSEKRKLLENRKISFETSGDKQVFRGFRESLGGNVRAVVSTSAPISAGVMEFFRLASGAFCFEAYGQTEVLGATETLAFETDGGAVGPPLTCNHIKLADVPEMGYFAKDDIGEVCVKGYNVFMGYYKNPDATKESLIDGWQHTGDIGQWQSNGSLKIIDRKKHLFKLSQGEYIAPEKIESFYSHSELIQQIYVEGFSNENYVVALVVPQLQTFPKWIKSKGYKGDEENIFQEKDIRRDFLLELHKIGEKHHFNRLEQVRNVAFLTDPFTVENELLTPTLKLKRNHARKHFKNKIQQLYDEGPLL